MAKRKKKPLLICLVGRTASGKSYIAQKLSKDFDIPVVASYTTRPMREGEVDGVDHTFLKGCEAYAKLHTDHVVAYTEIGEYKYFMTLEMFKDKNIVLIDPNGLEYMKKEYGDECDIFTIYVYCDSEVRNERAKSRSDYHTSYRKRNNAENKQFTEFESKRGWDFFLSNSGNNNDNLPNVNYEFMVSVIKLSVLSNRINNI